MVTKSVRALLREYHMIVPGETVLAAVSGGADSMCLLHLLWQMGKKEGFAVEAATFDHNIRPKSAQDAVFVEEWCRERQIPCHTGQGDVPAWAKAHGMGLEEAARTLRYEFLYAAARRAGAAKIATAHNANDNAETLLLHLIRGSGLNGLGGIAPVRGTLIRPLLTTSREEIERYLERWKIPHVEDETNADTTYSRNYLRHEVMPLLLVRNPNLLEGLNRSAKSLRQDGEYLERQADGYLDQAVFAGDQVSFSAETLVQLPEAIANRVVQRLAQELDNGVVLSAANRAGVLDLCRSAVPSAQVGLAGGLTARRVYDQIVLTKKRETGTFSPVLLPPGQSVTVGARTLRCEWAICPEGKFNQPDEFYLKAAGELRLRPRKTGDEITLPGRDRKTVKKLFIDSKIPRQERELVAVAEIGGRLAGVARFGADLAFLPTPGEKCYRITVE